MRPARIRVFIMKKTYFVLFACVVALFGVFSSCTKEKFSEEQLIGKWITEKQVDADGVVTYEPEGEWDEISYIFHANHTVDLVANGGYLWLSGTWELKESSLTFIIEGQQGGGTIEELTKNTLVITSHGDSPSDDITVYFRKDKSYTGN